MEFEDLRIFVEVAKVQSISKAAAGLHMGQPTVSQRMKWMESELGLPLLTRHRRGVQLTPAGQEFLSYATRVLGLMAESQEAVRRVGQVRPNVRLAGPPTLNSYLLPGLLSDLAAMGCDVRLRDEHSPSVVQQVLDGSVDVGFVLGAPTHSGIKMVPIFEDDIVCIAGVKHPLVSGSNTRRLLLEDVAGCRVAHYPLSPDTLSLTERLKASVKIRGGVYVETSPVESAKSLVATNGYLAFVPRMTILQEVKRGELAVLPIDDEPAVRWKVSMLYRDRKYNPTAVNCVLEAVNSRWGCLKTSEGE